MPLTLAGVSRISAAGAVAEAEPDAAALSALSALMPATAGWKLIFTMAALTRACSLQPLPVQPRSAPLPFAALQAPEVYMALGVQASIPAPPRPAPPSTEGTGACAEPQRSAL